MTQTPGNKILIVDDEVIITTQLEEYLKSMGYDVVGIATSGDEAIEKAVALRPNLILMDIVMPGDKDGITAADQIAEDTDIPIIFMTAYGGEKIIERAKKVEPYGFVLKPFQGHELKAAIEVALYRKHAEKQLRSSEEQYRSVVNTATEAIVTIDIHMKIIFWNRAAQYMFGYTQDEAAGQHYTFLIPDRLRHTLINQMDRMVLTEESDSVGKTTETIALCKDGSEFPMEFSLASWIIRDEIFFTIIARNITERKKIEGMKSDFVSLVSHQLRTPVAGILGCIDNMMSGLTGELTDQQVQYLKIMQDVSQRNYRIISDLLNISRIERGVVSTDVKSVPLSEIVNQALRDHQNQIKSKGLKLNLLRSNQEIIVIADKDKTVEALSNIIHNAFKFTAKGSITVLTKKGRDFGVVEVIDTGKGIPAQLLGQLFQKDQILAGSASTEGGCGLGLYIAQEFMKLQNGKILVYSEVDKGSRFIFEIPLKH